MDKAYAFFDVDGTLINGKSMFAFHDHWYQKWSELNAVDNRQEYEDVTAILYSLLVSQANRELINQRYYEFFAGRSVERVGQCAQEWAENALKQPDFFIAKVVARLNALKADGVDPVFVSGSFMEILNPIAKALNVKHILASRLASDGGKYNGRIATPQTIGVGKALAIQTFLADQEVSADRCWAFGDDISDLPMLEAIGNPTVISGDSELAAIAKIRGWPILNVNVQNVKGSYLIHDGKNYATTATGIW